MTVVGFFIGLLAIFAGLMRPEYVRKGRAFGLGVLFAIVALLLHLVDLSWSWLLPTADMWEDFDTVRRAVNSALEIAAVGVVLSLLRAFWPGGGLFSVSGTADSPGGAQVLDSEI